MSESGSIRLLRCELNAKTEELIEIQREMTVRGKEFCARVDELEQRLAAKEAELVALRDWVAKQPCDEASQYWATGVKALPCGACPPCVERARKEKA